MKKALWWCGLAVVGMMGLSWAFLCNPEPLFAYSASYKNLAIYSDEPFSPEAGERVLEKCEEKLAGSPLYCGDDRFHIFVCNGGWRRWIFFLPEHRAGGMTYYPFTSNVFLSGADIGENLLISPSGKLVTDGRTLDHFIVHEITHVLSGRAVGIFKYHAMPGWIKEGYPEYVGREVEFSYRRAVGAFLAEAPQMNWPKDAPYGRYQLLVSYVLEAKHWSVQQLLESTMDQETIERALREEAGALTPALSHGESGK